MKNPNMQSGNLKQPTSMITHSNTLNKKEIKVLIDVERKMAGDNSEIFIVPEHFSSEQQEAYKYVIERIPPQIPLSNADKIIIERAAMAVWMMRKCDEAVAKEGLTVLDIKGSEMLNLHLKIAAQAETSYKTLMLHLGMSPGSRANFALMNGKAKAIKEDDLISILHNEEEEED